MVQTSNLALLLPGKVPLLPEIFFRKRGVVMAT